MFNMAHLRHLVQYKIEWRKDADVPVIFPQNQTFYLFGE